MNENGLGRSVITTCPGLLTSKNSFRERQVVRIAEVEDDVVLECSLFYEGEIRVRALEDGDTQGLDGLIILWAADERGEVNLWKLLDERDQD